MQQGKHGVINRSVPYFKGGSVTLQIGTRDRQDDTVAFSTANSLTDEGFIEHRAQGRFHRVRMNITNATSPQSNWEFAQGVDVEGQVLGRR